MGFPADLVGGVAQPEHRIQHQLQRAGAGADDQVGARDGAGETVVDGLLAPLHRQQQEHAHGKYLVERVLEPEINQERQFIKLNGRETMRYTKVNFDKQNGQLVALRTAKGTLSGRIVTIESGNGRTSSVEVDGQQVKIKQTDNRGRVTELPSVTIDANKDNAFLFQYKLSGGQIVFEVIINGVNVGQLVVGQQRAFTETTVTVGGQVSVSELAIYERSFTEANLKEISDYYLSKYELVQQQ